MTRTLTRSAPEPAPTTVADPPTGEPERRPRPTRRRGRGGLALLAAAAAAIVALGWFGPVLLVALAPVSVTFGEGAPALAVDRFGGPEGTYVVGYEHDQAMDMHLDLANTGLVGVEVLGVELVTQEAPLLVQQATTGPEELARGADGRFTLPVRFDNCEAYHEREAMLVEHVDVQLRVAGRDVVERVPLDRTMMARSPMLWQCPDRTIDRSDDLRMGSVR